jgi:SET domain-containing protein
MEMKQISFLSDSLFVKRTRSKGRGVFTRDDLPARQMIERAPVIVMSGADRKLLDQTLLHDYIFEWGENHDQCCMALGLVPLYNHSYSSNCEYEMDFTRQVITIRTVTEVRAGEELYINYNGDWNNTNPVWFDAK